MSKLIQTIENVVQQFNDWYDGFDQYMTEWRDIDPEAYFNYIITNKEVN